MPASPRRSYHSDLKLGVQLGIVPHDVLVTLPRSSLHRFRSSDYSHLVGSEFSSLYEKLDLLKEISTSKAALSTAHAVLRVASFARSLRLPARAIASIRIPEIRRSVVAFVDRLASALPRRTILRLLGLSHSRFHAWARNLKPCPSSPLDRCRRVYPNQLTATETSAIRKAFVDPAHAHWPASSIAWALVHSGALVANAQTIIRYAKLLGLAHRHLHHRSRKRGSLAADYPNQAWHLDATVITTRDNRKAYLQILLDNFSRKIIAWKIHSALSGVNTTDLLRTAFSSLAQVPEKEIHLIVDGGPENNNAVVEAFLKETPLTKSIARVDVTYSNSMIEAVNKIFKYRYLFPSPIPDLEHLPAAVDTAIHDYNDRPHYARWGLTPNQAYLGRCFDKDAYRAAIEHAQAARRESNRRSCPPCQPFVLEEGEVPA